PRPYQRAAPYLLGTPFCHGKRFFGGNVAQFLKVELIHAAAIRLRDRDEVAADLNLFTLFRQMTEQMSDVPADSAYVRALQLKLGELVQLVKSERAIHGNFVRADLAIFLLFEIELVLNIADQLLQHIFECDHSDSAAKFINHHRAVRVLTQE